MPFALGKIGPLLGIITRLENEKALQQNTIAANIETSTEEQLDFMETFLKTLNFRKKKAVLYSSSIIFSHGVKSPGELKKLNELGNLSSLLNEMNMSEADRTLLVDAVLGMQT